ncbi:elongation factor P--(R)-beta-lysine ligase [Alteromonas sp. a30]|uniref:elongation factor P--(R)-beta-lysine ligase n=1 Tax=Alteromonas sp. a30 TaxID=2730917 RepID=UPI00228121DA|nr:elongation factor P--(R)-beta-lysine ligase [Alteromonas sp. a30]MCY7294670.1 elongation factor P--(R)-beta-lysine ligase [Alteromonas sp. a30]
MQHTWQPTTSIENLKKRGQILRAIRDFFEQRNILEVDTPSLSHAPVTDPHLVNFSTKWISPSQTGETSLYLQTSPEYAMKRLLAAGSGCIYQMGKAFRNEESGRYHNAEFTLLEWYRVGFDHWQLMDEVEALLKHIVVSPNAERRSYRSLFVEYLGIDPLMVSMQELKQCCCKLGFESIADTETHPDTLLQLLFCEHIETKVDPSVPLFVYDFPASQAALAKLNPNDNRVAQRFELYYQGVELANGFNELTDPKEQQTRFQQDNQLRAQMGLPEAMIDTRFIAALNAGLPQCAGVALGIDRLLMIALQAKHINEVIAFPTSNA